MKATNHFPDYDVRLANFKDIQEVMRLENKGFAEGIREAEEIFLSRLRVFNEGFWILESSPTREILGYLTCELWVSDENLSASTFTLNADITSRHSLDGCHLYISSMTTDPKVRGKGLGSYLFDQVLRLSILKRPNLKSIVLVVNEAWPAAISIYQKNGFVERLRLKDFFRSFGGEASSGIVMQKMLKT